MRYDTLKFRVNSDAVIIMPRPAIMRKPPEKTVTHASA